MPKIITFSPEQEAEICKLYSEDKLNVLDISRLMGVSTTPIFRVLRDNEVPTRTPGSGYEGSRNQKVMNMRDAGFSNADIGRALNISRQRVHAIISRGY